MSEEGSLYPVLFGQDAEIRDLKRTVVSLREELETQKKLTESALNGDCLLVIPDSFIACGERGYYCSASCKLFANLRDATAHAMSYFKAYEELKEHLK